MAEHSENEIDAYVGARIRERRKALGKTQAELALSLGLTGHQIQKYETAAARIGAPQLFVFAQALTIDVGYFFEGLVAVIDKANNSFVEPAQSSYAAEPLEHPEAPRMRQSFNRIDSKSTRLRLVDLVDAIADGQARTPRKRS